MVDVAIPTEKIKSGNWCGLENGHPLNSCYSSFATLKLFNSFKLSALK